MTRLCRFIGRFRKDSRGGASIEFVFLFPLFMGILLMTIETGIFMTRQVLLDRSVDIAVRVLRLNTETPPTFNEFKTLICDNSMMINDCDTTVQIELQPVDTATWSGLNTPARCVDTTSNIDPYDTVSFTAGTDNQLMLVRVCAIYRPVLPSTTLGLALQQLPGGEYAIVIETAFVNEPTA